MNKRNEKKKERKAVFSSEHTNVEVWDQANGKNHVLQAVLVMCYSAVSECKHILTSSK